MDQHTDLTSSTILIVDDSRLINQMITDALQQTGAKTLSAFSVGEAFVFLENSHVDLILLDVVLPDMNGLQACQKIKDNPMHKDIPIIFLSGVSDKENILQGFNAGAVDYVQKPFDRSELIARVKTHIDLRRAKEKLRESARELKELNATKDKIFSILAHDLFNPLSGIINLSRMLARGEKDESRIAKYSEVIHESSLKTYELIENLLDWAKSQTGQLAIQKDMVDLYQIVSDSIVLMREQVALNMLSARNSIKPGTMLRADRHIVDIVVRNLVGNAIKFSKPHGEINVRMDDLKGEYCITVEDNGIGIAPQDVDNLFRIGFNKEHLGNSPKKGNGLGLMICKDLVEKSGGRIWAESSTVHGTQFHFTLPKN